MQSFHSSGSFQIEDMPSRVVKMISPLDGGIFHERKEKVHCHYSLTIVAIMVKEWEKLTFTELGLYYKHWIKKQIKCI